MLEKDSSVAVLPKSFIEAVNQSYSHLFRTLLFFALVLAFLLIVLLVFFKSMTNNGEFKAEFTKDGGLTLEVKKSNLFSNGEKKTFASFLLPSTTVWFDTGLELDPGQECQFKISGRVHLAVDKVVEYAREDKKNPIPWSKPSGNPFVNIGDKDGQIKAKRMLLLKPGETIGNVVGYFSPLEETNRFQQYFVANRKSLTPNIFDINDSKVIPNNTEKRVRIFVSVNDILLDFDPQNIQMSELAYKGKGDQWLQKWETINSEKYENLFFDDNIGNFLVQVEIRDK